MTLGRNWFVHEVQTVGSGKRPGVTLSKSHGGSFTACGGTVNTLKNGDMGYMVTRICIEATTKHVRKVSLTYAGFWTATTN